MMLNGLVEIIFIIVVVWNVIGFGILLAYEEGSVVYCNKGSDRVLPYLNPIWLYKNYKVNIIGLLFLTLLFSLICPALSIIYWIAVFIKWAVVFIKWICTVGRK